MSSVLAIISKAVFEKQAADAAVGSVLPLDHYASLHKSLAALADGGSLFLVTVRPPDEQLWLVAVLENPKADKSGWGASPNRAPITNISSVKRQLVFTTGTGIQAKAGALGMSLQTPRGLTAADEALLRKAAGSKRASPAKSTKAAAPRAQPAKKATKAAAATKPAPTGDQLASLQAAMASKDGGAALATALAWWREQRAPALADVIDAISERVSGAPVSTQNEFTALASKANPLDLGRLLPAVPELQVNFLPALAELLARFPDDPRITRAFGTWLSPPITTSISKSSFWTTMNKLAQRTLDTRLVRALDKRLAARPEHSAWWERFYNNLRRTRDKLAAVEAPAVDAKPLAKLAIAKLAPIAATTKVAAAAAAPKLSGPLLAQAATHLGANRVPAAIDAMVACWRETRVPALADLIDRASHLLPDFDRPLVASGKALRDDWSAAFDADPSGRLPQLLQNLAIGDQKTSELQIAQLATLPDDPRISYRLAELCDRNVNGDAAQYWKTLFETLARHRDVRTFDVVRTQFDDFQHTYFYTTRHAKRFMAKLIGDPEAAFETWPLALSAADQKLFEVLAKKVEAAVTKAESRERALIAAITEDRKARGPREVYADWLMERNHPRGEYILLASKPKRSDAEQARLDELRKVPCMFGTLADLAEDPDDDLFRVANVRYATNTLGWRAAAASPLVALVETLDLDEGELPTSADFLALVAAATALTEIKSITRQAIEMFDPDYKQRWKPAGKQRFARI